MNDENVILFHLDKKKVKSGQHDEEGSLIDLMKMRDKEQRDFFDDEDIWNVPDSHASFKMPDGSQWRISSAMIATIYADILADQVEDLDESDEVFFREYEEILSWNPQKIFEWAQKNLSWKQIADIAIQMKAPKGSKYGLHWKKIKINVLDE